LIPCAGTTRRMTLNMQGLFAIVSTTS
jgi:hypothetical protein